MSKKLKIIVEGAAGQGKTTMAFAIQKLLQDEGFHVSYVDPDGDIPNEQVLNTRWQNLRDAATEIEIEHKQEGRIS